MAGHGTGVLAPGPAEGDQRVSAGVVAGPQRHLGDRARHPLVGDIQESLKERLAVGASGSAADGPPEDLKRVGGAFGPDRDLEPRGVEPAQQHVDIRQRQRPTRPVARGSGMS